MDHPEGFVYLSHDDYALTLLGVAVVIVVARLAGALFRRIGQPPVIGEVVAGIALGPSLLGHYSAALFPLDSRPLLTILATLGLVTFMFFAGLEMDLRHLGGQYRTSTVVAVAGTVVPFAMGTFLGLALYPSHADDTKLTFCLFMGAAMSITAFPVLARILIERELYDTPLGVVTMAAAAIDDALTWATLALVVAIISSASILHLPYVCILAIGFAFLMVTVVRRQLARFGERPLDVTSLSGIVAGVLLCSFVTSAIGIHGIFGAFLFGAVFPRGRLAAEVRDRLDSVALLLLPVFFVVSGLAVNIRGVGWMGAWQLLLIIGVAVAGKLLGAGLAARSQGVPARESVALGVLMNTRGLTELVVLGIGRELGVLDDELFTLLVLMAVATTVATGPLLGIVRPDPSLGIRPLPEADG
jgi:Kef-type K+ transport system membrane component KefB